MIKFSIKARFIRKVLNNQTKAGSLDKTEIRIAEVKPLIATQETLLISLNKKFISDEIVRETYDKIKLAIDSEKFILVEELNNLEGFSKRYRSMIVFLLRYGADLMEFYNDSDLIVKHRLLGSNFVQNLKIDSEKVRNAFWSPAMELINVIYNDLQIGIKEKGQRFADLFELAPPPGLEPGTP